MQPHLLNYVLSMTTFLLQWQKKTVTKETTKPKILTNGPL